MPSVSRHARLRASVCRWVGMLIASFTAISCAEKQAASPTPIPTETRSYRMGFASTPPIITTQAVLQGIDLWSTRAELAVFHEELPWTDLLNGMTPQQILQRDRTNLVAHLRSKGLDIVFMLDLTDGLSRAEEAQKLRDAARSLSEPAVQQLARDYALAVAAMLEPEYLGLAAETNLIRAVAPSQLYAAVVATANAMAADLAAANVDTMLFFSVQVETAWGLFTNAPFLGIAQDLQDFPFAEALGLSSYPYFVYDTPEQIPDDYYKRLADTTALPVFVIEGGWTSAAVGSVMSTPELQVRYIERHGDLLDSVQAIAYLQLLFADPDLSQWPQPQPTNLPLFTKIGLTDSVFGAKPALAAWDALFDLPRQN